MTDQFTTRAVEILLVEDNAADARLTREALHDAKIRNSLHVVTDGVDALAFLRRQGRHVTARRPDIVLLDLNLPKKSGYEVLAEIKRDPALARIPVVILTSSSADEDIEKAYLEHANCYVVKPVGLEQFIKVVHSIEEFWLEVVMLPDPAPSVPVGH